MSDSVEVPVRLDTTEAKSKLRDLEKQKDKARAKARSKVWVGMRAKTLSAIGAVGGFASVSRVFRKHSGPVDPWMATLVPIAAAVQLAADGLVGYSAISKKRARAHVVATLAANVGFTKDIASARDYYETTKRLTDLEERGRNIVRMGLQGPSLDQLIEQALGGYVALIGKSFDYAYEKFTE